MQQRTEIRYKLKTMQGFEWVMDIMHYITSNPIITPANNDMDAIGYAPTFTAAASCITY